MHVSSPVDLAGRRVLIIEDDKQLATEMSAYVRDRDGTVEGVVATPEAALVALDNWPDLDAVMVDVETADGLAPELLQKFKERGLPVLWIVGAEGWFFDPYEEATVYQLESDPENVVRLKMPVT